jgi:excisionase family DNA binding protein
VRRKVPLMHEREFLTVKEVLKSLPISMRSVRRWIRGGLPVYQSAPKAKVLIRRQDLEQFLKKDKFQRAT